MSNEALEGWYSDSFERHEARWLSNGMATKLVRDVDVTSYDDPPSGQWTHAPERLESDAEGTDGHDLARADAAQSEDEYDRKSELRDMGAQAGF